MYNLRPNAHVAAATRLGKGLLWVIRDAGLVLQDPTRPGPLGKADTGKAPTGLSQVFTVLDPKSALHVSQGK